MWKIDCKHAKHKRKKSTEGSGKAKREIKMLSEPRLTPLHTVRAIRRLERVLPPPSSMHFGGARRSWHAESPTNHAFYINVVTHGNSPFAVFT
jgi:hypothetical protein